MTVGTGTLFEGEAHKRFMEITGQRWAAMRTRLQKKGYPDIPFTAKELRESVLKALGGQEDGFVQCGYCRGFFTLADIAFDHAIPLSRGGSPELSNIEYPCRPCNNRKGSLTPEEYEALLEFLATKVPLGMQDVLSRLEMSVALAAGARNNAAVISKLKKSGTWKEVQTELRQAKKSRGRR